MKSLLLLTVWASCSACVLLQEDGSCCVDDVEDDLTLQTETPVLATPTVNAYSSPPLWPAGTYDLRTDTVYVISVDEDEPECELSPSATVTVDEGGAMTGSLSLWSLPLEAGEPCSVEMPLLGGRDFEAEPVHPCPGCSDYWKIEISTPADLPCCGDDVAAWWSIYDRQYWGWDGGETIWSAPGWELTTEYFRPYFETVVWR